MPQRHPSFTFIPIDISPIDCPECGARVYLIRRSPLPEDPKGEIRTFEYKDCGKQTEMTVQ